MRDTRKIRLIYSPKYSECERPQHQRLPQFKLFPLFHDMAPAEDTGSVECREEEGLLPVNRHMQDKRGLVSVGSLKVWSESSFKCPHQNQSDGAKSLGSALSLLHFDAHMAEMPRYRTATAAAASEVEDIW